jgi:hypothetical protein
MGKQKLRSITTGISQNVSVIKSLVSALDLLLKKIIDGLEMGTAANSVQIPATVKLNIYNY